MSLRYRGPMTRRLVIVLGLGLLAACGTDEQSQADCTEMECYRPYVCAPRCGGPETNRGCCSCREGEVDVLVDCEQDEPPAEPSEPETSTDGPCETDADCMAVADCDCACVPRARSAPVLEGEAWSTQCDGSPPPNCGAESPCVGHTARCDAEARRCVVDAPAE